MRCSDALHLTLSTLSTTLSTERVGERETPVQPGDDALHEPRSPCTGRRASSSLQTAHFSRSPFDSPYGGRSLWRASRAAERGGER